MFDNKRKNKENSVHASPQPLFLKDLKNVIEEFYSEVGPNHILWTFLLHIIAFDNFKGFSVMPLKLKIHLDWR